MIVIVCKSRLFGTDLLEIAGGYGAVNAVLCTQVSGLSEVLLELSAILVHSSTSVVLYEPSCFIDPAPFKKLSPATSFIVLYAPGDETSIRKALLHGANAVVNKPVSREELDGVLTLVTP